MSQKPTEEHDPLSVKGLEKAFRREDTRFKGVMVDEGRLGHSFLYAAVSVNARMALSLRISAAERNFAGGKIKDIKGT